MELEYKTISAQTPLFSDTGKMHEVLDEEAKAGWSLFEKENNHRIKLVRDTRHRENDKKLNIDPYRSTVGVSSVVIYGATAVATLVIVSLILFLALWSNT